MPKNKCMYAGVLIVAATAILWGGSALLIRINYIFPWTLALGVLMIVGGVIWEGRKPKEPTADDKPAE